MPPKLVRPKQIDPSQVFTFSEHVEVGSYRLMPSSSIPHGIPQAGDDCQAVVLASAEVNSSDVPGLPSNMTPSGPVYLWRAFRTNKEIDPPRKVDDGLYYTSSDGSAWSIHSKDSPDHHRHILSSTDMGGLIDDWELPSKVEGTLDEYRISGGTIDFTNMFGDHLPSDDEDKK